MFMIQRIESQLSDFKKESPFSAATVFYLCRPRSLFSCSAQWKILLIFCFIYFLLILKYDFCFIFDGFL